MDVARLNFSHGSAEEHAEVAERVRDAADRAGRAVAILQDLPGPKLRIGKLRDDVAELGAGDPLTFVCGDGDGGARRRRDRMFISWDGLADAVGPDEIMYLADGSVRLRVDGHAAGRRRDRHRGRDRRRGRLAPGPQHPRRGRDAARRARGGPRAPARPARRSASTSSRCRSCAARRTSSSCASHTRLPLIAKIEKPQAVAARRGDRARRRLRDGRARRPRHRDARSRRCRSCRSR